MRPDGPRDPVAGPDEGPAPPFPLKLSGKVIKGFGRGSKELGIPTANIPLSGFSVGGNEELESGIYFGWAGLDFRSSGSDSSALPAASTVDSATSEAHEQKNKDGDVEKSKEEEEEDWEGRGRVFPMVMSVGWNPFYKNEVRSVEVHIMHHFPHDFYGAHMNLLMLGFIRPEYDYVSKESLIDDIRTDVEVTRRSLARPAYARFKHDRYLLTFPEGVAVGEGNVDASKGDVAS